MQLSELVKGTPRTELLYYGDSYLSRFEANVVAAVKEQGRSWYIVLDKTLFHPKGGGQPTDTGQLLVGESMGVVKKAMMVDGRVVHYVKFASECTPQEGTPVKGEIDWPPRQTYMRRHTAAHLLDHCLNVASSKTNRTTTSWLGEPEAYVAYAGTLPAEEVLFKASELARSNIEARLPVSTRFLSKEEVGRLDDAPNIERLPDSDMYRVVQIDGFESIPCGGTHVRNTLEIGKFILKRYEQNGEEFRVYFDVA
ncbi:MAG: alanyl-tRNA editing protein [Thermoprotei archaeon]